MDTIRLNNAIFTDPRQWRAFEHGLHEQRHWFVAESDQTRIIYDQSNGSLYYDADGIGSKQAIQFATLDNHPADLTADDFLGFLASRRSCKRFGLEIFVTRLAVAGFPVGTNGMLPRMEVALLIDNSISLRERETRRHNQPVTPDGLGCQDSLVASLSVLSHEAILQLVKVLVAFS